MIKLILTAGVTIIIMLTGFLTANVQSEEQLRICLERSPAADAKKSGVLTEEAIQHNDQLRLKRKNRPDPSKVKPTHANVSYGTHERNLLDLWLAESKTPTPILICIHGGGFRAGDKSIYHNPGLIKKMHQAGISVAAINYRFTEAGKNPYPAAMHDGARAIQFLRYHAEKYNLDKKKFSATGYSAGACILMWLGFHSDLADAKNRDPILRESSRLQVLAPVNGPTNLYFKETVKWFEVDSLIDHPALRPLFALPQGGEIKWTEKLEATMRDASAITHLSRDDPPIYMTYPPNSPVNEKSPPDLWVHHPLFGIKLKEEMDKLGLECHVQYQGGEAIPEYRSQLDFIIRKLKESSTNPSISR